MSKTDKVRKDDSAMLYLGALVGLTGSFFGGVFAVMIIESAKSHGLLPTILVYWISASVFLSIFSFLSLFSFLGILHRITYHPENTEGNANPGSQVNVAEVEVSGLATDTDTMITTVNKAGNPNNMVGLIHVTFQNMPASRFTCSVDVTREAINVAINMTIGDELDQEIPNKSA